MASGYILVNYTNNEKVYYLHIPATKARELAGNPISSAITTWYLLKHKGEAISFVSDTEEESKYLLEIKSDINNYKEVTDEIVNELIQEGIIIDEGIEWADEKNPKEIYIRALRNIWMDKGR
jgi:hypothetical protein